MKQKSKPASKPIDTFRVIAISPEMQTEIINHATLGLNIEEIALHLNLDERHSNHGHSEATPLNTR